MAKLHKIYLYGVSSMRVIASPTTDEKEFGATEAELDLEIEAPDDIEADLLAAGLNLRGFTNDEVLQFREVLRHPEHLQQLKRLMLESVAERSRKEG